MIINLQKENEILKENAIHNDEVVDNARWYEMIYKSRIDEAIKEINKNKFMIDIGKVLDILEGKGK